MTYDQTPRRRRSRGGVLDSPFLAAVLVVVIIGLIVAIVAATGLLRPGGPGATATPGAVTAPPPTGTPAAPTFVRPTPSPAPTFLSYVVQAGDTLTSIAREFRTTARSIAWWNRGAYPSLDPQSADYDPNSIRVGWVLVVLPGTIVDENNPPTPSPGPPTQAPPTQGPTAAPTTGANVTPPPTTAPAGPAAVISHGSRTSTRVALTFDMGGRLDPALDIVGWLIDHEVHATLFPTGASGSTTAIGKAAMELAATRPDLFDFANHSWSHPDFRDLTAAAMADELRRTEDAMKPIVGTTKPWFRPPFGGWNDAVRAGVGAAGWRYLVMWDVDTIDWRPVAQGGPTAAQIVSKIDANARGGSIVLMHLGGWNTLEALPGILAALEGDGLQPVTLSEMFAG